MQRFWFIIAINLWGVLAMAIWIDSFPLRLMLAFPYGMFCGWLTTKVYPK
jgi:hypothetical protein